MGGKGNGNAVCAFRIVAGLASALVVTAVSFGLSARGQSDVRLREESADLVKTSTRLESHIEQFIDFRSEQRAANREILEAVKKQR